MNLENENDGADDSVVSQNGPKFNTGEAFFHCWGHGVEINSRLQ